MRLGEEVRKTFDLRLSAAVTPVTVHAWDFLDRVSASLAWCCAAQDAGSPAQTEADPFKRLPDAGKPGGALAPTPCGMGQRGAVELQGLGKPLPGGV